jgi:hypothetical protein
MAAAVQQAQAMRFALVTQNPAATDQDEEKARMLALFNTIQGATGFPNVLVDGIIKEVGISIDTTRKAVQAFCQYDKQNGYLEALSLNLLDLKEPLSWDTPLARLWSSFERDLRAQVDSPKHQSILKACGKILNVRAELQSFKEFIESGVGKAEANTLQEKGEAVMQEAVSLVLNNRIFISADELVDKLFEDRFHEKVEAFAASVTAFFAKENRDAIYENRTKGGKMPFQIFDDAVRRKAKAVGFHGRWSGYRNRADLTCETCEVAVTLHPLRTMEFLFDGHDLTRHQDKEDDVRKAIVVRAESAVKSKAEATKYMELLDARLALEIEVHALNRKIKKLEGAVGEAGKSAVAAYRLQQAQQQQGAQPQGL